MGYSYTAHNVDISQQENYAPEYIALKLVAYRNKKIPLVGHENYKFDGCTSNSKNGFDATVVPTLVDLDSNSVFCCSNNIIGFLVNTQSPGGNLGWTMGFVPTSKKNDKHAELVDEFRMHPLQSHGNPEQDNRPKSVKEGTE